VPPKDEHDFQPIEPLWLNYGRQTHATDSGGNRFRLGTVGLLERALLNAVNGFFFQLLIFSRVFQVGPQVASEVFNQALHEFIDINRLLRTEV